MPYAAVEYLYWLTIAGFFALYLRLRRQGLHRTYRMFAAYVLFRTVREVALAAAPPLWYGLIHHQHYERFGNNVYAYGYTFTQPIDWVLKVLVVLELYSLVFQNYKGLASMSRWAVIGGLTIAVLLSSLPLSAELSHSAQQQIIVRCDLVVSRGLDASLVVFLLLISAFLAWFPVPLSRNIVVYSWVYAVYFIVGAIGNLVDNLGGERLWSVASVALVGKDLVCIGLWAWLLNRAGESKTVVVRHAWTPQREEQLVAQLTAINASLTRSARR
jgi:hypothetical protein